MLATIITCVQLSGAVLNMMMKNCFKLIIYTMIVSWSMLQQFPCLSEFVGRLYRSHFFSLLDLCKRMQRFNRSGITCTKSFIHASYHTSSILLMTRPEVGTQKLLKLSFTW